MALLFICFLLNGCSSTISTKVLSADANDDLSCSSCHGSNENNAPPKAIDGSTSTDNRAVGAHQSHLKDGNFRVALTCDQCHLVPQYTSSAGHIDSESPAEVTFGDLAKIGNFDPVWTGTTCTGVYCHGSSIGGGTITSPVWTQLDGTQAACGTCHSLPPPPPHTTNTNCASCHSKVVNSSNVIIDKTLHINGEVNVDDANFACNSCHGGATNNAPPKDTSGNTTTTSRGVGAHQKHVMASDLHAAYSCIQCHILPSAVDSPGHRDTALPAEIVFGALAKTGNLTPAWNGTTCANTYCHGTFTGGLNTTPQWTGTQARCGSCHATPPATGDHQRNEHRGLSCVVCHGTGYTATTVRVADHVNGLKNVGGGGSRITTWNAATLRCTPTCHGAETW